MRRRVLVCISITIVMVIGNEMHANIASAALNSVLNNGGTTNMTSGKWGSVAAAAPTDSSTGQYVVSVQRSTVAATGSYFSIRNVGTLPLLSMTLSLNTVGVSNYTTNIDECLGGTWNESNGACTGGTITLVRANTNAQTTSATWTKSINPSTNVRLRIQYVASGTRTVTATINLTVARSDVRAATNTSS